MIKLSTNDIIKIHDTGILMFGGEFGLREEGTFDMLCNQPYQSMFGDDLYPSLFDKAAKYVEGFARHQVFIDGNKRTGLSTMVTFLKVNGYDFVMENDKAYEFVMRIANDHTFTFEEISQTIQDHCIAQDLFLDYEYDER